jgi:hypothetical protein
MIAATASADSKHPLAADGLKGRENSTSPALGVAHVLQFAALPLAAVHTGARLKGAKMPITCLDIEGGRGDVTASAAAALGQRMADRHRMTIIHAETTDGEHYLTVEGMKAPGRVRSISFIYPTPTRWQRLRAFPR